MPEKKILGVFQVPFSLLELSNAAKKLVQIIWDRKAPLDQVFVSGFGADITRKDLLTLSGLEWLNDEGICFYSLFE